MAADLMSVAQFKSQQFLAANGTPIPHPTLAESVKSVYVRGRTDRLTADPDDVDDPYDLALLTFPVDLSEPAVILPADKSVVLTADGKLIAKSVYHIGYRVGFFGDPSQPQTPLGEMRVKEGDTVYIEPMVFPGGIDASDQLGRMTPELLQLTKFIIRISSELIRTTSELIPMTPELIRITSELIPTTSELIRITSQVVRMTSELIQLTPEPIRIRNSVKENVRNTDLLLFREYTGERLAYHSLLRD